MEKEVELPKGIVDIQHWHQFDETMMYEG